MGKQYEDEIDTRQSYKRKFYLNYPPADKGVFLIIPKHCIDMSNGIIDRDKLIDHIVNDERIGFYYRRER